MTLKQIGSVAVVLAAFFLFGWFIGRHNGRNSVRTTKIEPIKGVVTAEDLVKGMTETKPDTVFVPVYVCEKGSDRLAYSTETQPVAPEVVPIENLDPGPERNGAIMAVLTDWNTKRYYKGTLFDDPHAGTVTYGFDVQFNRAGQIDYHFDPAPVPKARPRLRPTVGGEIYTNGQHSFGGGVQYGAFGLNVRALKLPGTTGETGYAFGVGAQIVF